MGAKGSGGEFQAAPQSQRRTGTPPDHRGRLARSGCIPFLLDRDAAHRREIAAISAGSGVMSSPAPYGRTRRRTRWSRIWNSIEVLNTDDDVTGLL